MAKGSTCVKCGTHYADRAESFYTANTAYGWSKQCKRCTNAYSRAWHRRTWDAYKTALPKDRTCRGKCRRHFEAADVPANFTVLYSVRGWPVYQWRCMTCLPPGQGRRRFGSERWRPQAPEAKGRATEYQITARVALYGGRCWICGGESTCIDHVKPLSRGGSNWPANLRPACATCNGQKGSKLVREFFGTSRTPVGLPRGSAISPRPASLDA